MDAKARIGLLVEAQGASKAKRDVEGVGKATSDLGSKTAKAGTRMQLARNAADRFGGALRTMARWARYGAIAVGGIAATGIGLGIKLNAQWESINASFRTFLGSTRNAEKFTERLRQVSAKSPLRLTEYAEGARMLMGFGMSARRTLPTLKSLNKAIVATGGTSEDMMMGVRALGQMQARGKASAEELNQLAQIGLPVNKILQKELGLTGDQVANIGVEGIKSEKALAAIGKGWNKQFGKAFKNQQKSFGFMWATFKKQGEQSLRLATKPLFDLLTADVLPRLNKEMEGFISILNDDSLSTGEKWDKIRDRVGGLMHELNREIDRADLDDKLLQAFEDFIPMAATAAGKGAGKVAWAFFKGWLKAGIWGKLFTVALLAGKLGAFGPLASLAARKFMLTFAPQLAAKMGIEMAASGAIGTAATAPMGRLGGIGGRLFGAGFAAAAIVGLALLLKQYEDEISDFIDSAPWEGSGPGAFGPEGTVIGGGAQGNANQIGDPGGARGIGGSGGSVDPRTNPNIKGPIRPRATSSLGGRPVDITSILYLTEDGKEELARSTRRVALRDLLAESPA